LSGNHEEIVLVRVAWPLCRRALPNHLHRRVDR